jgi:hypothetical protein
MDTKFWKISIGGMRRRWDDDTVKPQFYVFWELAKGGIKLGKFCSYGNLAGTMQNVCKITEKSKCQNKISGFYCIKLRTGC